MLGNMYKTPFSLGEKIGVVSLLLALLLFFVTPSLAVLPLIVFLILCFGAPFFPRFSFFLPVISCGKAGGKEIALTFDDGPSPQSTPILLELLARHNLHATFFVIGEKAAQYPELIESILEKGHTIGNHSWNHDYFLMLKSTKRIQKDIQKSQEIFKQYGVKPVVFRPPVGITGARLGGVLAAEEMIAVNYSCRAFDGGNRNIHNLAEKILGRVEPGAVIMLHDLPPYQERLEDYWQKELDQLFDTLKRRYTVASLEQLIERPVMVVL
ncbi:MAG: peptidoglycan/xylan/chitin deacetylase (PgdA/CDA1 family) [Desulforhopalus sp.]